MRQYMQKLVAADELLCHQLPETFATVGESDVSWTEKIWASLFAKDGSIQIDCGLGKYHNRDVMDMFAGISRGKEQWTVRASRRLSDDPERTGVGPFDYGVSEPLQTAWFRLRENDALPLSFDVTVRNVLPPFLERGDRQRAPVGYRISSDILRYHQAVVVSGWVKIGDETVRIDETRWTGFRDHSWGVRMDVGEMPRDIYVPNRLTTNFILQWSPMVFTRPDGSMYEIHHYLQEVDDVVTYFSGFENRDDGSQVSINGMRDELKYDPGNRRLLGGMLELDMGWGKTRQIQVEPVSDTGFHLGTGLYFGFKGHRHGMWLGPDHLDGERFDDCSEYYTAREVHQLRDCVVRVSEGDATGYGIFETIVVGEHGRYGLDRDLSFL
ncbi:MAG: hypothetical protein QOJ23_2796 [Actinomycetota bacterium]|nr:hypothetical protein [Actinomycetota bacterium]